MNNVVIYTRLLCPYCAAAKRLLKRKGVGFIENDGTFDFVLRDEMVNKSNGRKTFPQIFIGNQHIGGYDELKGLDRRGKLDALLPGT